MGACWSFIGAKLAQLHYGFYPAALRWQVNASLAAMTLGSLVIYRLARRSYILGSVFAYSVTAALALAFFAGALPGTATVASEKWGGLSLTLILLFLGVGTSFFLGGVLALSRRSRLTIVRSAAAVYVELMRGVPLIAILFIAVVMLPLFLPSGGEASIFLRALVGICLYTSAYMAEAIGAGIDAIEQSQLEAADALGLSRWTTLKLVVFPQAMAIAMPGLTNTLISLVKDTSLVMLVGMHDLMGTTQLSRADNAWGNVMWEAYLFAGLIYVLICQAITYACAGIERSARSATLRATED